MFEHIDIPMIYEENLIEFRLMNSDAILKYHTNDKIVEISFKSVYKFDFCDFEYMFDTVWEFGFCKYLDSPELYSLIEKLMLSNKDMNRAFGRDADKLVHYRIVIDDVGMYNIICKDVIICSLSRLQ